MNNSTISRRSFITGAGATLAGLGLAACGGNASGGNASTSGEDSYKIGVLQLTEHAALDAANKGFVAALDESGISYSADQQNAQNDQSICQTIASKLVNDGDDLILAIATPAAQAVAGATTEIPIVATAITDFAASGLVAANDAPGGNVTGTSDLNPVAEQIDLISKVAPEAATVGLLYCTAEANSLIQVELAEAELDKLGLSHDRYTVSSSNEIQSVTESMVGKVDVIYTPTDNVIASGISTVVQIANEKKVPTICGEEAHVIAGGLISYSVDYEALGHKAGEMAVKILKGEDEPANMPIEALSVSECKLIANKTTAELLGVDLSQFDGIETVE